MKKTVISRKCLPSRSPLGFILLIYLLLERHADIPGWGWGVYWTLSAVLMIGHLMALYEETEKPLQGFGELPTYPEGPINPPPRRL